MTIPVTIIGGKSFLLAQEEGTDAYCMAIKPDSAGWWGGRGGSRQQFPVSKPEWAGAGGRGLLKKTTTTATKC